MWSTFSGFLTELKLSEALPVQYEHVLLFIIHQHSNGYAAHTITSQMSGLSYVHKLLDISDPTSHFVIRKTLVAICHVPKRKLIRMPISIKLLYQLVDTIENTISSQYQRVLFKAMFLTAFHVFFTGLAKSPAHLTVFLYQILTLTKTLCPSPSPLTNIHTGMPQLSIFTARVTGQPTARLVPLNNMSHEEGPSQTLCSQHREEVFHAAGFCKYCRMPYLF